MLKGTTCAVKSGGTSRTGSIHGEGRTKEFIEVTETTDNTTWGGVSPPWKRKIFFFFFFSIGLDSHDHH